MAHDIAFCRLTVEVMTGIFAWFAIFTALPTASVGGVDQQQLGAAHR